MSKYHNCHYWNSTIYKEWWTTDSIIYRGEGDLPSIIIYDDNGSKEREVWHDYLGRVHRDNKPAIIIYDSYGEIIFQEWYKDGKFKDKSYKR